MEFFGGRGVLVSPRSLIYSPLLLYRVNTKLYIVLYSIVFIIIYYYCLMQPDKEDKLFVIKPIPTVNVKPVIIFINPKSGGNQGVKLLQKFQWHLNPRQVFDLSRGGPRMGLELYKKVPNLRVLACGGDGTVGWVLSILDQIANAVSFPVGVLPLGTGNDLARALGWGGVSIII